MSESTSPIQDNANKADTTKVVPPSSRPGRPDPLSDDRPRVGAVPWVPVSIVLHLVLLLLLVLFAPVDRLMETTQADATPNPIQADRVEELSKLVEELNSEALRKRVEEIVEVREKVEEIEAAVLEEYTHMEEELKESAASDTLEKQAKALEEQKAAADALAKAAEAKDREAQAEAMRLAREAQVRVEEAQIEARRALTLAGEPYLDALKEQAKAEATQEKAEADQVAADKSHRDKEGAAQQLSRAEAELAKREAARDATKAQAEETQKKAEAAEKNLAERKEALAAMEGNQQKRQLENSVRNAESQLTRANRDASQAKTKAEQAEAAVAEAQKTVADRTEAVASTTEAVEQANKKAVAAQNDAIDQQTKAMEQVKKTMQAEAEKPDAKPADPQVADASEGQPESDAANDAADSSSTDTPEADPSEMDMAELYDKAKAEEQRVLDAYHQMRAAQLAVIRKIPLDEAKANVDRLQSDRPDVSKELAEDAARTSAALAAQKEAVATALRESQSMVDTSQRVLSLASTLAQASTPTPDVSETADSTADAGDTAKQGGGAKDSQALASLSQRLNEIGEGDTGTRVKDVADIMAGRESQAAAAAAASSSSAASAAAAAASANAPESSAPGEPGQADAGAQGDPGSQTRDGQGPAATPPPLARNIPTVSGRKIANTPDAQPGKWMAVRTWYMIGPWPNPQRKNIDRSYPPESAVDLDATYADGKDGRTLRWEFLQSPTVEIKPPDLDSYAIYYAYTEIYSDKAQDLWIAVGSDDKSTVWINDFKVWESASDHKGWRIDEGFRRVHFQKGVNRVLYRLENGHLGSALSLVVELPTE